MTAVPPAPPEARIRFIEYNRRRILFMDFSDMEDPAEMLAEMDKARRLIAAEPPASLLTLTDVTGTDYNAEVIKAFQALAAHNKPFVKAAASVTRTPLQLVALRASAVMSRRKLEAFADLTEAKSWLASHADPAD
jgi:hypothetical protein